MLHAAAREGLVCPAYCLMPDHLHLVWMGLRLDTDQINGMAFLRTHLERALAPAKFQSQAHDHVLRAEQRRREAFAEACRYDLHNPVRAGLVHSPEQWAFSGAVVPGYPRLHPLEARYWPRFWKLLDRRDSQMPGTLFVLHLVEGMLLFELEEKEFRWSLLTSSPTKDGLEVSCSLSCKVVLHRSYSPV